MKIRERIKQVAVLTIAGLMVTSGVVNAAEVEKDTRPALVRYSEGMDKINKFPERDGKKSFRVVEVDEVLKIDNALQEYIDYSIMARNPKLKKDEVVKNRFSIVGMPKRFSEEKRNNEYTYDYNLTHALLKDYSGVIKVSHQGKTIHDSGNYDRPASFRSIKAVEGYNPYKKVSKEQLERGIQIIAKEANIDLGGVHFILSPYNISGTKGYVITNTGAPFLSDGEKEVQRTMARIIIEADETGNILASALTGLGELMEVEANLDGDKYEEVRYYSDMLYLAEKKDAEKNYISIGDWREETSDTLSYAEDFRYYAAEIIKEKDKELAGIIEADKDLFYGKQASFFKREGKEKEIKSFFKDILQAKPEVIKQEISPEIRVNLGKQGTMILKGREHTEGFRRLATDGDKMVITIDDSKTKEKIKTVKVDRRQDIDFAYLGSVKGQVVKKGANNQYVVNTPKGKTTIRVEYGDLGNCYEFEVVRK